MQAAIRRELGLAAPPEPADVADALAVAMCHYHLQVRRGRWPARARPARKRRRPAAKRNRRKAGLKTSKDTRIGATASSLAVLPLAWTA